MALVALAGAAVLLAEPRPASGPDGRRAEAAGAAVSRTVLACPPAAGPSRTGAARTRGAVQVGLARVPGQAGPAPDGAVSTGPVGAPATGRVLTRGRLLTLRPDASRSGRLIRGDGSGAVGLVGFRTDRGPGPVLAVTGCAAPRAEWWFTGAGAGLDHSSTLLLANVDAGPAVVDLRVLGPDGEVDTAVARGMALEPHSTRRVELAGVAPQTDELALEVNASRGRVVAAVSDSLASEPGAPAGREWLAGAEGPARTLLLTGVLRTARTRTLLVANPSDREASVDLAVSGRDGIFTPTGVRPVTIPPGATRTVDVTSAVPSGEPVAVRLRSPVPVLAALRSVGRADHAYAVPGGPVVGAAAAALVDGARADVQLTAAGSAARASIAALDERGRRVGGTTLSVAATATRAWSPPAGAASVVVTPRAGVLRGAVAYGGAGNAGVAVLPLTSLPLREQRPAVRPVLR